MTNLLLVLTSFFLLAHEDLESTQCQKGDKVLTIKKQNKNQYNIKDWVMKKEIILKAPQTKDFFDKKNKQVFDTYTFKQKDFNLIVRRPETKGPVKKTMAEYKGLQLICQ